MAYENLLCQVNTLTEEVAVVHHSGGYTLTYFDSFIDDLLSKDRVCDIILPRLTQRSVLEETEGLPPRQSLLVSLRFNHRTVGDALRLSSFHRNSATSSRCVVSISSIDDPSKLTRHEKDEDETKRNRSVSPSGSESSQPKQQRQNKRLRISSRTPSRTPPSSPGSGSRDRFLSRSRSGSKSDSDRYVSRSPSVSDENGEEGDVRGRYISRSPSLSPDRVLVPDDGDERIEGDV